MYCIDGPAWFYRLLTLPVLLALLIGLGIGSLLVVGLFAIGMRKGYSRHCRDERTANL
jgi:hypothetical protein